jgi:hypothetical protein
VRIPTVVVAIAAGAARTALGLRAIGAGLAARPGLALRAGLLLLLAAGAAAPASGQPALRTDPARRGWVDLSGYAPSLRSTARADGVAARGRRDAAVDLERELGLGDPAPLATVAVGLRLGDGAWVEAEYLRMRREQTRRIDAELAWGDATFPAGAVLDSRFEVDVVRMALGVSLLERPTVALAARASVYATRLGLTVAGEGSVDGGTGVTASAQARKAWVPLPTLGLEGRIALAAGVDLAGRFDWLSVSYGGTGGRLLATSIAVHWAVDPSVALYLGWRRLHYDLTVDRSDWSGALEARFSGPQAGAVLRF